MIQNDNTQTLMDLGLTLLQAKTYLALAKLGKADVKTIAKASNVARQDIYRIMPTLQKLGLGEKIIAKPTMYKVTPIKIGLSILLQQKMEKHCKLQEKTKALINNFKANSNGIEHQKDDSQFIITSEKSLFIKKIDEAIDTAQMSQDIIFQSERLRAMLFHHRQHLKRATMRGVKIRIIIEKPENHRLMKRIVQTLKKNSFFKLRYTSVPTHISIMIFDNKEVNIRISDDVVPCLWSNNPNIVTLSIDYFDELWKKAFDNFNLDQK